MSLLPKSRAWHWDTLLARALHRRLSEHRPFSVIHKLEPLDFWYRRIPRLTCPQMIWLCTDLLCRKLMLLQQIGLNRWQPMPKSSWPPCSEPSHKSAPVSAILCFNVTHQNTQLPGIPSFITKTLRRDQNEWEGRSAGTNLVGPYFFTRSIQPTQVLRRIFNCPSRMSKPMSTLRVAPIGSWCNAITH